MWPCTESPPPISGTESMIIQGFSVPQEVEAPNNEGVKTSAQRIRTLIFLNMRFSPFLSRYTGLYLPKKIYSE
jgi:hypothetical protein